MRVTHFILSVTIFSFGCSTDRKELHNEEVQIGAVCMFRCLGPSQTGLKVGYFEEKGKTYEQGVGLGVGDFNNDGLPDVFFLDAKKHSLFINQGGLVFKESKTETGIETEPFDLSLVVADFNNDGWEDIAIAGLAGQEAVRVYVNNRDLTFSKVNTQGVFALPVRNEGPLLPALSAFDYDNDGFLDIFLTTWKLDEEAFYTSSVGGMTDNSKGTASGDLLVLNDSLNFHLESPQLLVDFPNQNSFGARHSDLNADGLADLYIPSDFNVPDYLFFRTKGQGFRRVNDGFQTTSYFSMGTDIGDIDNDGLADIFTVDMRRSGNSSQKGSIYEVPYGWNQLNDQFFQGTWKQEVKNTLQLNKLSAGFAEVSEMVGIDATGWSWGTVIADFNNDGLKDIFISTGAMFDYRFEYDFPLINDSLDKLSSKNQEMGLRLLEEKGKHYNRLFINGDSLRFVDRTGLCCSCGKGFSSGLLYSDLDLDGDLDIIVNKVNDYVDVLENVTNSPKNFLRVRLLNLDNRTIFNSQIFLFGRGMQYFEIAPVKGIFSTSEKIAHFGLGSDSSLVDSLWIRWPDGMWSRLTEVRPNQVLDVHYDSVPKTIVAPDIWKRGKQSPLLQQVRLNGLDYKHSENEFIDYRIDPLLPQMYSREGPDMAVGDLDGNGKEDVVLAGALGTQTSIYFQNLEGSFRKSTIAGSQDFEDVSVTIIDYDKDGLNDLLVSSGGNEFPSNDAHYLQRLYRNKGNENFELTSALPELSSSSSCVKISDVNNDGWDDIFIGGRIEPQQFPSIPESYLLINNKGTFYNAPQKLAPELRYCGMVTDALWTDIDIDGDNDLIVVGEYMSPKLFLNEEGQLTERTDSFFEDMETGYWGSIATGDFNEDGRPDYIVGNLGLNTRYKAKKGAPLIIYANDFDDNGSVDVISTFFEDGRQYTVKNLNTLKPRIDGLAKKFPRTSTFASSDIWNIFDPKKLKNAQQLTIESTESIVLLSGQKGKYKSVALPRWAQVGPIMAILVRDLNKDGHDDVLISGNFYHAEVERGRYTAMKGLLLEGDGTGKLTDRPFLQSGFIVRGEGRDLDIISVESDDYVLATQNNDSLRVFKMNRSR